MTARHTGRQTEAYRQADRGIQAGSKRHTGRQTDRHTSKQIY